MYRCFSDIIVKGLSGPKTIYRKNNSASARRLMEMSLNVVISYKMRGVPTKCGVTLLPTKEQKKKKKKNTETHFHNHFLESTTKE